MNTTEARRVEGFGHKRAASRNSTTSTSATKTNQPVKGENERDFLCRVRDAFRIFARNASEILGTAWAFVFAIGVIVVWAAMAHIFDYSDTWQLIINTGTTIITFLMVFLIQNTQNRDSKALHLKLDELIRAVHGARNQLVNLEQLSDDDLKNIASEFEHVRKKAERKASTAESNREKVSATAAR
jgi:low affinity Fe/Cu permease